MSEVRERQAEVIGTLMPRTHIQTLKNLYNKNCLGKHRAALFGPYMLMDAYS